MSESSSFIDAGFAIFDQPIIKPHLLQQAKANLAAICAGQYDRGRPPWGFANQHQPELLQRIEQIHSCSQAFYDVLVKSDIGAVIADVIGAKQIKVWGSQLYIKPPSDSNGANVGWHRDSQHVPFITGGAYTLWIPLDGCDCESGPLSYVFGSQDKSAFAMPSGAQQQDLQQEQHTLTGVGALDWQISQVIVPQGGFSLHHWDLIHGSGQNRSAKPRYGLSVGIATEDFSVDRNKHDYGYLRILEDDDYCPTLFKR